MMLRLVAALLLLWLAPAATGASESYVAVSEGECLRVVDAGRGRPVVLIPGLFGSAFGFRKLVQPLVEGGHRVLAIEPLGIGSSCRPRGADYSLTAQADRIAAVLDALAVDRAVLVAHSVGASIALRLACRHPDRVAAIVSLDGGPTEAATTPGLRRALRFSFLLKLFGGVGRVRRTVRSTLVEHSVDPSWVTDEVVEGYMGGTARDLDGTLRAYKLMSRAREPERLAPRLREVRCPVRLVLGETKRQGGVGEAEIALLAAQLEHFEIDRVPDSGSLAFEENPQAVVAAIERATAPPAPRGRVADRQ